MEAAAALFALIIFISIILYLEQLYLQFLKYIHTIPQSTLTNIGLILSLIAVIYLAKTLYMYYKTISAYHHSRMQVVEKNKNIISDIKAIQRR